MQTTLQSTALKIAQARRDVRRITLDRLERPTTIAEAYALQAAIGAVLVACGSASRGWKVGAANPQTEPTAAPIFELLAAPARMRSSRLRMIGVEAEIAYICSMDLPTRSAPYSQSEVFAAIDRFCVAIEVCDSRLSDWQSADDLTKLADHQLNVALVAGSAIAMSNQPNYRAQAVRTLVNGSTLKDGVGCHALGDPSTLLPWLANHAQRYGGLRRGDVITTGSWLGMHFVRPGDHVRVEFPGVGHAEIEFPAA
jgi:2-keto-4-pentenoate hydratase